MHERFVDQILQPGIAKDVEPLRIGECLGIRLWARIVAVLFGRHDSWPFIFLLTQRKCLNQAHH
jgi:hypothetical protein